MTDSWFAQWGFVVGLLWIAGWIGLSILFRSTRGKPIIPRLPADPLYRERAASGHSRSGLIGPIGMLGGAQNCLMVCVTADDLVVTPFFPFNLMFLPEIYGLEHRVARRSVRAQLQRGPFGKKVRLNFDDDGPREIVLRLSDPEAFVSALGR